MNVTKAERKESTKHCCGNGCRRRDSAEHKEEGGALIGQRITENNVTNADRNVNSLLERIVSPENLNQAYKRVVRNKGARIISRASFWTIAFSMRSSERVSSRLASSMTSTRSRSASASIKRGLTVSPSPSSAVW